MRHNKANMIGPSGFFLPSGPDEINYSNDLELIYRSKDGFNELYRVQKNGRFFVYKALKPEFRGNLMYEDLLTKDFNIGFSLSHPGLCQYYGKIQHPQIGSCIIMEWIDGCSLEGLMTEGRIDRTLAQKIICEICDALGYMHRKQIIHRDLKPENILITHNGQNVKIIDFGLSDADSFAVFKSPAGTRAYASPELIAGDTIDVRSDIWSLGVIINELHPYYRKVAQKCLIRNREARRANAELVKNDVLREGSRRFWSRTAWAAFAVCIITGAIIWRGSDLAQPDSSPAATVPETPQTDSSAAIEQTVKEELATEHKDSTVHKVSAPAKTNNKSNRQTPSTAQTPVTPAAPKQSASTPSEESIDAESLEDLFNQAARQIL